MWWGRRVAEVGTITVDDRKQRLIGDSCECCGGEEQAGGWALFNRVKVGNNSSLQARLESPRHRVGGASKCSCWCLVPRTAERRHRLLVARDGEDVAGRATPGRCGTRDKQNAPAGLSCGCQDAQGSWPEFSSRAVRRMGFWDFGFLGLGILGFWGVLCFPWQTRIPRSLQCRPSLVAAHHLGEALGAPRAWLRGRSVPPQ